MKLIRNKNSGYTLLEILFYISLLAIFSIAVVSGIITMTQSFKETALSAEFAQGGVILERLSREVRAADSILSLGATSLRLSGRDNLGAPRTLEFSLSGTDLQFFENDTLVGNLNISKLAVESLSFTQINTVPGQAVKMSLSVQSTRAGVERVYDFYNTVLLRGIYAN